MRSYKKFCPEIWFSPIYNSHVVGGQLKKKYIFYSDTKVESLVTIQINENIPPPNMNLKEK